MSTYEENIKGMELGAVTLLDILGWKGIWQRKEDAIETLLKLITNIEKRIDDIIEKETIMRKQNPFKDLKVEVKSISDTLALVTYGERNLVLEFHAILTNSIIATSIRKGIPVRGAISYGYFSTKNNIMVGPAIDEVASWYEMAEWIGAIVTPSALFKLNCDDFVYKQDSFVKHQVPIKQYGKFETYCCNWPRSWEISNFDRNALFDEFIKMGPITPNIAAKFMNTLDFYNKLSGDNLGNALEHVASTKENA